MSTEIETQGNAITFDRSALDAVDVTDAQSVDAFVEQAGYEVREALAMRDSAAGRYIVAAASATLVAVQSGILPTAGRAGEGQLDAAGWIERLTGRPAKSEKNPNGVPANEVNRWRNAAKALQIGMDPGSPEFGVVTQTPKGITTALDEAVKALGKGKTDTKRAETIRRNVVKTVTAGDNGGNGTREVRDITKLSLQDVFAHLHKVLETSTAAYDAAEDDKGRQAALDMVGEVGKRAEALHDAAHTTASDLNARAQAA